MQQHIHHFSPNNLRQNKSVNGNGLELREIEMRSLNRYRK